LNTLSGQGRQSMTREIDRLIVEKCRQITEEKSTDRYLVLIEELTKLFDERDLIVQAENKRPKDQ
jgi:hypothetical protein